jgi:hypothetical protein
LNLRLSLRFLFEFTRSHANGLDELFRLLEKILALMADKEMLLDYFGLRFRKAAHDIQLKSILCDMWQLCFAHHQLPWNP